MYLNNYILGYLIIIFGTYAILEFLKINQIINKKGNIKRFFTNVLFVTYIFLFCMIFYLLKLFTFKNNNIYDFINVHTI